MLATSSQIRNLKDLCPDLVQTTVRAFTHDHCERGVQFVHCSSTVARKPTEDSAGELPPTGPASSCHVSARLDGQREGLPDWTSEVNLKAAYDAYMVPKYHFEQILRSAAVSAARKQVGDHSAACLPDVDPECYAQVRGACGGDPCDWQIELATNCFTDAREQLLHNIAKAAAFVHHCQQLFLHRIASRLCKHKLDMNQVYQVTAFLVVRFSACFMLCSF